MGLAAAMLIVQEPFVVASLLLLAGLIGGLQLVDQPVDSEQLLKAQTIRMALKYMLLVALGGVLLLIGFVLATAFTQQLAETGPILFRAIFGLLLIGFSLRVALLPFHVWLPDLADEAPPATLFVHGGLLTILAVPVLLVALQTQPQLLVGNEPGRRLLLGLGVLSAFGGGLLSLASNTTRRVVVYLAIANLGLIAVGLGMTSATGIGVALLTSLNHILGLAIMTIGLTLLEQPIAGRREQAGAMRERPIAALALLLGTLLLVGVPPLSGFVPKLMMLTAAAETAWAMQILIGGSFVLSSLAATRMLRRVLLLPPETLTTRSLISADVERLGAVEVSYISRTLVVLILLLAFISFAGGIWPQPIMRQIDDYARSLPFIQQ
jgi:formate hydrogenlyase subunit 3/multisubunit Na+/H+ antiporter MnhD subunit